MTTPFDPDIPNNPEASGGGRKLRPWWRWNLVTLAIVLFVALWVRELAGVPLSGTWGAVCFVSLVWWLAPSVVLRRLPWPLSLFTYMEVGEAKVVGAKSVSHAGWVCRVFAVLIALGGCYQVVMAVGLFFQGGGYYGRAGFGVMTAAISGGVINSLYSFGLAAGLWTVGSIARSLEWLEWLVEIDRRRPGDSDASNAVDPQG